MSPTATESPRDDLLPSAADAAFAQASPDDDLGTRQAVAQAATMAASVLRPESTANDSEHNFSGVGGSGESNAEGPVAAPVRSVAARALPGRGERGLVPFGEATLNSFTVPIGREEEWRFTPLDRLRSLHEGAPSGGKVFVEVRNDPAVRVDVVERTDALESDGRLGRSGGPGDRVSAQAWESWATATVVTVPKDTVPATPITVNIRGEDAASAAYGHLLLDVGAFAEATVIIDCTGSATYADNVEVLVGDGAKLNLVAIYDWAGDAVHVSQQTIRVGRDATVRSSTVSLGGSLVRLAPSVTYAGPGGDAELLGLYFAGSGQHLEHRLFVDHAVPHCRSNVLYKGALQGQDARTVWIGDVLIRAAAEGTDTYEMNRNLLLTDGARADSVPNLEIETGEIVGAGHASATGRFDDEQLFYLMSRGVPELEARRLVVRGFFADLVHRMGVPEVEERVMAAVEAELAAVIDDIAGEGSVP